jgi:hypothetical protein
VRDRCLKCKVNHFCLFAAICIHNNKFLSAVNKFQGHWARQSRKEGICYNETTWFSGPRETSSLGIIYKLPANMTCLWNDILLKAGARRVAVSVVSHWDVFASFGWLEQPLAQIWLLWSSHMLFAVCSWGVLMFTASVVLCFIYKQNVMFIIRNFFLSLVTLTSHYSL